MFCGWMGWPQPIWISQKGPAQSCLSAMTIPGPARSVAHSATRTARSSTEARVEIRIKPAIFIAKAGYARGGHGAKDGRGEAP